MNLHAAAIRTVLISILGNALLAAIKIVAGTFGHSYALVADGIESINDALSSILVLVGLKVAAIPPDQNHPYGHGRAEQLAALASALSLLIAGALIAIQSLHNLQNRHHSPEWFTLPVLLFVITVKLLLSRYTARKSQATLSTSLDGEAHHHLADAITSGAAFLGISIALIGGDGFEKADDVAALIGCSVIVYNGIQLLRRALHENMDGLPPEELLQEARQCAAEVAGVLMIEKLRMKKSGVGYLMDIHVQIDGTLSVLEGHRIGHRVQDHLKQNITHIMDVVVHIEPYGHD